MTSDDDHNKSTNSFLALLNETILPEYWLQYFTATIHEWKPLLFKEEHNYIIINCLQFLVTQKKFTLYRFVIMNTHVHIIWQPLFGFTPSAIQTSFMKHTLKQFKATLQKNDKDTLATYKVNKYDRTYQFWKREPLSIEVRTAAVFSQKPEYIHNNPVVTGLCSNAEDYYYSSARFYHGGTAVFKMLTHSSGN